MVNQFYSLVGFIFTSSPYQYDYLSNITTTKPLRIFTFSKNMHLDTTPTRTFGGNEEWIRLETQVIFVNDWFKDAKVIQFIFSYLPTRAPSF